MIQKGAVELPDEDVDSSSKMLYQGHRLLDDRVQDEVDSLFEDGEQLVDRVQDEVNNAHPLLKVLTPIVLDQVRFVRVFFCDHGIANYNGNGFILCRRSVMPMTSTAGQAHP